MIRIWNIIRKPFIVVIAIVLIVLFSVYIFTSPRVTGDAASHLLLAISPILKIGAPYKDFWDIKPPMTPLTLFLWSKLFGFGILSIRTINILLPTLSILLTYFIYKKVFKTPVFEIVFLSTVLVLLSPFLHSIMLPTEMLGLFLSLLALLILISSKNEFNKCFFSGLLFFLASQSKEPFTFTAVAVLPVLIYSFLTGGVRRIINNLLIFITGLLVGLVAVFSYLKFLGSFSAYREVFAFKGSIYKLTFDNLYQKFGAGIVSVERTFTEFPLGILILFVLVVISLIIANKYSKKFVVDKSKLVIKSFSLLSNESSKKHAIIFYAVGSFVGFGLGNAFGSHYLIQVVVPFYIISGMFLSYLYSNAKYLFNKSKVHFWITLIIFIFSIVVVIPKRQYIKSFLPKKINFVMTDEIYDSEKRIAQITTKDQCILSVYGWGAGENYLYSGRRPCTRYFLPNIAIRDWQKDEYGKSIQENPPAAIIYQTNGADLDIEKFESEVINIDKIVKNCYQPDIEVPVVYVPKDSNSLNTCVIDNSN